MFHLCLLLSELMQSELSFAIELIISYANFKIYHCPFYGLSDHPVHRLRKINIYYKLLSPIYICDTSFFSQILSESFLKSYGKDIINIHHGLLPSFKGGHPSRQVSKLSDFICEANMKC